MNNHSEEHHDGRSDEKRHVSTKKKIHLTIWQFILILLSVIIITTIIAVSMTIGINHKLNGLTKEECQEMKKIELAYKTLDTDHYKKQNPSKLSEATINGTARELKDPYFECMTKSETKSFNKDVSGNFVDIDAEIQKKNKDIMIISPMKDSPVEKAGLQPKDTVTKVDGKSVVGKPLDQVVKVVRGKGGSNAKLTIKRGSEEKDANIKRGKIHVKNVEYKKKGNIGVFTITKFQQSTAGELKSAIIKAHNVGVRNIILNLCNNPGGLLDEAVKMANIFIGKGQTVVQLEKGNDKEAIKTSNDALKDAKDMGVSILVNEGSASASEVFTGVMKDHHKAKVYGSKTFGKGVVQTTREPEDGSLLKYTQMERLTPDDHYIHGKGIRPDVTIDSPRYQSLSVIPSDKTYSVGDSNKNVKSIEIGLDVLDYYNEDESNQLDNQLANTIKLFQSNNQLSETGKFDTKTNEKSTQLLVERSNNEDTVLGKLLELIK